MTEISKALEWIKLRPRHLAGIAIASGMYLLLGPSQLGLTAVDARIRPWVAGSFLISVGFLVAHASAEGLTAARRRWSSRKLLRLRQAVLHDLSPEEKEVLAAYILQNTKSLQLSIGSGVAGGLEAAGVIFRASAVGTMGSGFAYNIQPWAWEYLREHPELLSLEGVSEGGGSDA